MPADQHPPGWTDGPDRRHGLWVPFLCGLVEGGKLVVQRTNADGGLPGLRRRCGSLADVRNTAFKVGGAACVVRIDCGGYPATKARD